ncbi:hypothetical protein GCM10010259_57650 [Streptomyces daghestanicus]|uniref:Cobyrinic acid a,c-diamide synthase n=2 Tax=Streptomyces TaxID=1883 RepID=A0A918GFW3_STRGD|nr:hypothetical protein GCM10010238_23620 [Streptomyces niveoruber]GGT16775.1 hypothetical protein GCM10010240_57260 [Streptomyces griseoviridis]GGU59264.1 hypothetical protein GCM10010259_57650 [Streptomyces daghestanicus]GHI28492.1 hypothetical protein Sdagh_02220 [Streptomyces daghestanicus]
MSLPGADELFRTTGGTALQASTPRRQTGGDARVPAPAGESGPAGAEDAPQSVPAQGGDGRGAEHTAADAEPGPDGEPHSRGGERSARRADPAQEGSGADRSRKRGRAAARRPSGRERHDEKITVYVSAEELMDLEHARLVLRGEHGLAVDRGRIVREAVAVVLADLESRGDASILVRRLRGR